MKILNIRLLKYKTKKNASPKELAAWHEGNPYLPPL
jgi:hypothetical protein